ncbi:MAG: hypothetical protein J6D38_02610 [Solobacterium sp.]|nr:hypothetical protein [Solobacterium sp.]
MTETKEDRILHAGKLLKELEDMKASIRSESICSLLSETRRAIEELRDAQYLFDSGEKELIRLYERYLPYLLDILKQYQALEVSGNYEAIQKSRSQLEKTLAQMNDTIKTVTKILPQDEIDEANARAKAEELRRLLEEQRNSVIK